MEVLQKTKAFFDSKGIDNARLEAELIFSHVLDCPRLELYLQFERPLDEAIVDQLRGLVVRRSHREPLQYVLGEAPFRDLTLKVDSRVLIPRPETELLVDYIIEHSLLEPRAILDLGTGSGALALALAQEVSGASVLAVDASAESLTLARENAQRCRLADKVSFLKSDWFSAVDRSFDLIVSNPPYLSAGDWEEAQPEVRLYEPKGALFAGNEGLLDLETIMCQADAYLNESGMLALETGTGHHEFLEHLANEIGYARTLSLKDDSGRNRFFFAWV